MRPTGTSNGTPAAARRVKRPPIAVVVSRYHADITTPLLDGARAAHGDPASITVIDAPGAFELVALALAAARSGRFEGVVTLGCIVRGETRHDRYIAQAVADGLVHVTLQTGVPVALGVLTVETMKQARARAGGSKGNKGAEAMDAVLQTIDAMKSLGPAGAPARRTTRAAGGRVGGGSR